MKNFKNIGKALSRNEMRSIGGGRISAGGSGGQLCEDQCNNDSDCNCNPCGAGSGNKSQTCQTIHCAGTNSRTKKVCSCWYSVPR